MSSPTVSYATAEYGQVAGVANRLYPRRRRIAVAEAARRRLDEHHHFHGRAHHFEITHVRGALIIRGKVPSFYLKQVLQTTLKGVDGVVRIVNDVDVVCSNGVSSISTMFDDTPRTPK